MKSKVALFPFSRDLLSLVRNFDRFLSQYQLSHIVAPRGIGVIGQDVGLISNHPAIGQIVISDTDLKEDDSWDALLLDPLTYDLPEFTEITSNLIYRTLEWNKKVIIYADMILSGPAWFREAYNSHPDQFITYGSTLPEPVLPRVSGFHYQKATAFLIGGLVESNDAQEILIRLFLSFRERKVPVTLFLKNPLYKVFGFNAFEHILKGPISTPEKIIEALNALIITVEEAVRPRFILFEAPDALIRFSRLVPNGFGIESYMLAQAVRFSGVICSISFDILNPMLVEGLSNDFVYRFGTNIRAVNISNILCDQVETMESYSLSSTYVDISIVDKYLNAIVTDFKIPVFNIYNCSPANFRHISQSIVNN